MEYNLWPPKWNGPFPFFCRQRSGGPRPRPCTPVGYGGNGRGAQGQAEEHARLKGKTKEIQEELEAFWQAPPSGADVTAQAFWGEPGEGMVAGAGKKAYPNLWKAARHFLCFSASNGELERFFSAAQQLLEQKRRRGKMGNDTPQKLLLLRANGAALGLPDYWEMEKPKEAGHNEPVEEEEEEGDESDESDEDEGEEAEEKEARGELAGSEEESHQMGEGDSQKGPAITAQKRRGSADRPWSSRDESRTAGKRLGKRCPE